jgi:thiol-disulfide isomerase/thioredoxin
VRQAVVIVSLALLTGGCYNAPDPGAVTGGGPGSLTGAPAQSFDVRRTDGRIDSLAHHRGSVVLLNLWATWCPPCRDELPALEQFARTYAGRVVVLGVDQGESASVARDFARARGVTYPILVDLSEQYGRAYQGLGLPTTVIVDRDGHVVRGIDGAMTLAQMREVVAPVLAKP